MAIGGLAVKLPKELQFVPNSASFMVKQTYDIDRRSYVSIQLTPSRNFTRLNVCSSKIQIETATTFQVNFWKLIMFIFNYLSDLGGNHPSQPRNRNQGNTMLPDWLMRPIILTNFNSEVEKQDAIIRPAWILCCGNLLNLQ